MCVYTCIHMYIHICIYIYREREICIYIYIYVPIYIYICIVDVLLSLLSRRAEDDEEDGVGGAPNSKAYKCIYRYTYT